MLADLAVIFIILFCIFLGFSRGLIRVAVRFLSFFVALIVALILYTPISNYIIENTEIVPNLQSSIETKIYNKEDKEEITSESANLSEMMQSYINNYTDEMKENTSEFVAKELAVIIVRVATWIGLFVVMKILLIFVRFFADAIGEIPIIKQFNKFRWDNIWYIRGICTSICFSCYYKYSISNDRK